MAGDLRCDGAGAGVTVRVAAGPTARTVELTDAQWQLLELIFNQWSGGPGVAKCAVHGQIARALERRQLIETVVVDGERWKPTGKGVKAMRG